MTSTAHTFSTAGQPPGTITTPGGALAALSLALLMPALDTGIANAGLPVLARALDASFAQAQWIVLAYLLALTALAVGVGRLGDRVGRRRLLLLGIALFTAASLLCAMAGSLWLLVAARAVQGLGAAAMAVLAIALVGEAVPPGRAGRAMGLLGTMSAVGTASGPALGGILMTACGWRAIFLVNLPLGLLAWWLAWRHLPADRSPTRTAEAFDWLGTALLALTLAACSLAVGGAAAGGLPDLRLLAAAGIGSGLFVLRQARARAPLLHLALLRDPRLAAGLIMGALVAAAVMTTLVVGPFHLAGVLGLPPSQVGLALALGPLVAAIVGVPAGRLVDRHGSRAATGAGLLAMVSGAALLAALPASLVGWLVPLAVLTAGYALFQAANNTAIMAGVAHDRRGLIAGLLSLARNLGLVGGTAAMGAVFTWAAAGDIANAPPAAIAGGMRTTFAVVAGLLLVTLALALVRPAPRSIR